MGEAAYAWDVLSDCQRTCREDIQKFVKIGDVDSISQFRDLSDRVCQLIADALLQIFRQDASGWTEMPVKRFYVWPGYSRITLGKQGRVDTVGDMNRPPGYGFEFSQEGDISKGFTNIPLRQWMAEIYEQTLDGYSIGGFTSWLDENKGVRYRIKDELKSIAAFRFVRDGVIDKEFSDSILHISVPFEGESPESALAAAKAVLEKLEKGSHRSKVTPFPPIRIANQFCPPCRDESEKLFSRLWGSIFGFKPKDAFEASGECPEHRDAFNAASTGFSDEPTSFEDGVSEYYVIPMEPSIKVVQGYFEVPSGLGTVNLFTSFPIRPELVRQLKRTLELIYGQLRTAEALATAENTQHYSARRAQSHEIKKLITLIDDETPKDVLREVKKMFAFQFAADPSEREPFITEVKSKLGQVSGFCKTMHRSSFPYVDHGIELQNLPRGLRDCILVAFVIAFEYKVVMELTKGYRGLRGNRYVWHPIDFSKVLAEDLRDRLEKLFMGEEAEDEDDSIPSKHEQSLIAALVCAFRNVVAYAFDEHPITVLAGRNKGGHLCLFIFNYGPPGIRNSLTGEPHTRDAMWYYVKEYESDPEVVDICFRDIHDKTLWKSTLPLPRSSGGETT
ncbi:MAG: hypothetical protein AAF483_15085 [Planctomycetota bacterium]